MSRSAAALLLSVAFLLLALLPQPSLGQQSGAGVARAYREENGARIIREFAELLSMPNVASDSAGIYRNAVYIRDRLSRLGVESRLLELPGAPPVVYGRVTVPGATRTLGLYVHYDGQPADPANWTHEPWTPILYTGSMEVGGRPREMPREGEEIDPEWRIYARSSGDDKAPIGAMLPVLAAFQENGVSPTSNLVFFFEGEEEAGSPHLGQYLETYQDLIEDIDVWLFFDGPV
ncbi:MAG: M20/M25/M40 family metallo-hydrolase, partial [Gemmatimonadetes bacterium]|nr:M20/M25/M40 family metallo-hydrolase [Gemmatimonadota bacterium]